MPQEIRRLADQWLCEPVQVSVAPQATPAERVEQSVYFIEHASKPQFLAHYLREQAARRTLVFTKTKHGADKLVRKLVQAGIRAEAIHGNKSQNARQRALEQFKSQHPPVLVATDIASRGLDISGVSHVINFDLPMTAEIYVHRIGRTARAGAAGIAVTLCDRHERSMLRDIERLIRQRLSVAEHAFAFSSEPEAAGPARSGGSMDRTRQHHALSPAHGNHRHAGRPHKARRNWAGQTKRYGRRLSAV
jgi:ATP-dependent RNA helicase RhlE